MEWFNRIERVKMLLRKLALFQTAFTKLKLEHAFLLLAANKFFRSGSIQVVYSHYCLNAYGWSIAQIHAAVFF